MNKPFSKTWISSKRPGKQVKYRLNAPLHIKRKFLSAHLSKELREKYQRRAFPVVVGDKIKIMRGQYSGKEAKVETTLVKKSRIIVTGIERSRKDGSKSKYIFQPSNLMIIELNLKDNKRRESLERNINQKPVENNINKETTEVKKEIKEVKEAKEKKSTKK